MERCSAALIDRLLKFQQSAAVLSQHASEASFLFVLRRVAICAPHYNLADLSKLDNRLEAHLDGLRIAGEDGWKICQTELSWKEPGEVFVAATLAFESAYPGRIEQVIEIAGKKTPLTKALISALGWLPYEQAEPYIKTFVSSESTLLRRIGVATAATDRRDMGNALSGAVTNRDSELRARALQAIGELGRTDLLSSALRNLNDEGEDVRYAAAWSAALLNGDQHAVKALQAFTESGSHYSERALGLAVRRMNLPAAHAWRTELASQPGSMRWAVMAAGAIGDPTSIPWLISLMSDPKLARVAGEAFSAITGVDIAYEDLDAKQPENFESGPSENPEDPNVDLDPDENLPWPDPAAVDRWWGHHENEFRPGERYLLGKLITSERLHESLRKGRQRMRAAAALELAIQNPGQPLFNTKAPGFRQQELLGIRRW